MKGGELEILLASAEGLKHARLLRSSRQYVVVQCGNHTQTSKITSGKNKRAWWNEKFVFKLSNSEWKRLTKINFRIMESDKFVKDCSIGQATIHLRGILREGDQKGSIELKPAPYNIVLKDGSYSGELKVGLKYVANMEVEEETMQEECNPEEKQTQSICRIIIKFTLQRLRWPRFLLFQTCTANTVEKKKDK